MKIGTPLFRIKYFKKSLTINILKYCNSVWINYIQTLKYIFNDVK